MNVLFVGSDGDSEFNCEQYRCVMPFLALRRAGLPCNYMKMNEWQARNPQAVEYMEQADLILLQRNVFGPALNELSYWIGRGKPFVIDLDDAYKLMQGATGSPSYMFWRHGIVDGPDGKKVTLDPKPTTHLEWGVKLAGAVSSPSRLICQDWAEYARTYWLPNYIESRLYRRYAVPREQGLVYIGWGGSMTHLRSFQDSGAEAAIFELCKKDKRVRFIFGGDPRMQTIIKLPAARIMPLGWKPYALWSESLSWFDIGLIPLSGEYDRRRSWIKTLEYGIMGIPWIATDLDPNRDIPGGRLVKNTAEAWYAALEDYVAHLDDYKAAAKARVEDAMEYDVNRNVGNLLSIYSTILREAG